MLHPHDYEGTETTDEIPDVTGWLVPDPPEGDLPDELQPELEALAG